METQEQQRTPVEEDPDGPKPFSCHICLDTASEPVVTGIQILKQLKVLNSLICLMSQFVVIYFAGLVFHRYHEVYSVLIFLVLHSDFLVFVLIFFYL
jgi:hypothetical protein